MTKIYFTQRSIAFFIALIVSLTVLCGQMPSTTDPFVTLNIDFRKKYKELRTEVIDQQKPTILLIGNDAILIGEAKRDTQRMLEPIYHDLKTIAHIPFAVYLMLVNKTDVKLSKSTLEGISSFRNLMTDVHKALPERNFSKEQITTQEIILKMSFKFIDQVLNQEQVSTQELSHFILSNRPYFEKNIDGAVKSQIDKLHDIMEQWYSTFSEQEKNNLKVLVSGPQVSRKNTLAVQYFSKYLKEAGEGSRIFYTEGVYAEEGMMNIMGNYNLSVRAGIDMFENPDRLLEDLLGQSTRRYLQNLKF